jgi:predicted RND superfamily exporter protein
VSRNVIAPSEVDAIEQAGAGQVRFEWLMKGPPKTQAEALKVRDRAISNPLLKGTMVSEDGKALVLYLPITSKDFAYQVRKRLLEKIGTFQGEDQYYITGLPVAEDTFGVEMFVQMAISAPLAMMAIFLLMLAFFRNIRMIVSPMIIAMVSVIYTMGLLIGTGNTVHIMSSMIPIFLMPIAVVDSIHILSEFFDRYQKTKDRRKTLEQVMNHLFVPILYTSLTSAAGFASLALTPIPPVRVFGIFVAFGILLAWLLTIIFIPAYVMMLKEETLENFGVARPTKSGGGGSLLSHHLRWVGGFTYGRSKLIVLLSAVAIGIAGYGISRIQINDNPVKWFKKDHDIRVADRVLNEHFGGTYEAYLVLEGSGDILDLPGTAELVKSELRKAIDPERKGMLAETKALVDNIRAETTTVDAFFERLINEWETKMDTAPDEEYDLWADSQEALEQVKNRGQIFKRPDVLNYISALQEHLRQSGTVGKSNSVTDLVKKVHQELYEANREYYRVPDTVNGVAQSLISFQNSHKPDDLWHLVTPDYARANIWVQLKNGDNKDMEATVKRVARFMEQNPPPVPLKHNWAGLTFLNVVWQDKMVKGMLKSFLGSFLVVFVMMSVLFRSPKWGLLAMVPLSVTIALIYGIIGIIGKDYDMPVAVLSSLTLGLAVDFAIHFLERSRETFKETGSWKAASREMFEEPARAIARNVIVIAVGFMPLLLAPLVPYQTVGVFLASIMAISGLGTMFILPALITVFQKRLFRNR